MLKDFERGGATVTANFYNADYQIKLQQLTPQELTDLFDHTDSEIDRAANARKKICCSSFMCEKDWWGTPLWPVYMKIANHSHQQAGMFWGLVVKDRVIHRAMSTGEHWGCIRTDLPNARGLTYWMMVNAQGVQQ
jgi:hypothetical protein